MLWSGRGVNTRAAPYCTEQKTKKRKKKKKEQSGTSSNKHRSVCQMLFAVNSSNSLQTPLPVYVDVSVCVSFIPACWQVDKSEDVVFNEAGETQEDRVEEETCETQASVQGPLVQVNSRDLQDGDIRHQNIRRTEDRDAEVTELPFYALTVINTEASKSPTEKISPLLFSLTCKRKH